MTNGLKTPQATAWPPGPPPRAAREAPPQSDAFAGMLDAQQARTATAEGHKKSPERAEPRASDGLPRERPAADEATAAESPADAPAQAPAEENDELVTAAVVVAPVVAPVVLAAPTPEAPVAAAPVAQAPAETPVPVAAVPTPEAPAAVPAAPVAATPAAANPVIAAVQEAPTTPVPAGATVKDNAPQPATPSANASPKALETPPRAPADGQGQQQQPKDGLPSNASAVAQQVARVANPDAPAARPEQAQAPAPAPAPAPVTAPPTAPAAANALRGGLPQATPVPLSRAAETVENVLRLASARGVTHARIALRPAELGSVDVHLRSTAEGIVARVVAHSAEAVQHLQQAAGDLRRSLEEQGLTLLNLDIGSSGERSAGRAGTDSGEFGNGQGGEAGNGNATGAADETVTENSNLRLPNGVLVDVLA
jgi:Meckel syndrome type 1 protein